MNSLITGSATTLTPKGITRAELSRKRRRTVCSRFKVRYIGHYDGHPDVPVNNAHRKFFEKSLSALVCRSNLNEVTTPGQAFLRMSHRINQHQGLREISLAEVLGSQSVG